MLVCCVEGGMVSHFVYGGRMANTEFRNRVRTQSWFDVVRGAVNRFLDDTRNMSGSPIWC